MGYKLSDDKLTISNGEKSFPTHNPNEWPDSLKGVELKEGEHFIFIVGADWGVVAAEVIPEPERKEETAEHILPCPFCGGRPIWVHLVHPSGIPGLQCNECQFLMKQDRRDKTIFYWNRRAQTGGAAREKELEREAIEDHKRLVRELDTLLNGKTAAKQASLCDIVSQVSDMIKNKQL